MKLRASSLLKSAVGVFACWFVGFFAMAATATTADSSSAVNSADAIVNGSLADTGAQPWMAAFVYKYAGTTLTPSQLHFCGGSLIAPQWVLTAAHCVDGVSAKTMQVIIGREFIDGTAGTVHEVERIVVNPHYGRSESHSDIALVKLATASSVTPVLVANKNTRFANAVMTAIGWGSISGKNTIGCNVVLGASFSATVPVIESNYSCDTYVYRILRPVTALRKGSFEVLTNTACNTRFRTYLQEHNYKVPSYINDKIVLYPDTLCAADAFGAVHLCYGDSGGPLLAQESGAMFLTGVSSFILDRNCSGANNLQFFTDIRPYADFIADTISAKADLTFDSLCPTVDTPKVSYDSKVNGLTPVRVSWGSNVSAIAYDLLFVPLPNKGGSAGKQQLPATTTEIKVNLPSGSRYVVAVQAKGRACDSRVSKTVEVKVP